MLRRVLCCFAPGGTCRRPKSASINDEQNAKSTDPSTSMVVASSGPRPTKGPLESPVLVEMFTSQGCGSCPPADLLLSQLGQGRWTSSEGMPSLEVPVVVLAFHVDFWDYMGWKDPFASSAWTLRQRSYGQALQQDSIYTPEIVIQGRVHCNASSLDQVVSLINKAPRFAAPDYNVSLKRIPPQDLEVNLELTLKFKVSGFTLDVTVVLFENGLVTNCDKGENKGRLLTNDFVVRSMARAASLQDWPAKKTLHSQAQLPLWPGFARAKAGLAFLLQNPQTMEVYGAYLLDLPEELDAS